MIDERDRDSLSRRSLLECVSWPERISESSSAGTADDERALR